MEYPTKNDIPYEEIENGALILLLLRESKTWEELCSRYRDAEPAELVMNTTTMTLLQKLYDMRELGLITFADEETPEGKKPAGEIKETGLWSKIRVAFGGLRLSEVAMLSRHSKGVALAPLFGRPRKPEEKIDVFVMMPYNEEMEGIYVNHIKKLGDELKVTIRRANELFSPGPFMEKVWDSICSAPLILADCTQRNPNVFYEAGIAHTVGKKVVFITRSPEDVPSDIQHFEYITYDSSAEGAYQLVEKLRGFITRCFKLN